MIFFSARCSFCNLSFVFCLARTSSLLLRRAPRVRSRCSSICSRIVWSIYGRKVERLLGLDCSVHDNIFAGSWTSFLWLWSILRGRLFKCDHGPNRAREMSLGASLEILPDSKARVDGATCKQYVQPLPTLHGPFIPYAPFGNDISYQLG